MWGMVSLLVLRSMVLRVEASCGGQPLASTGGDSIPDFGGHYGRKAAGAPISWRFGALIGLIMWTAYLLVLVAQALLEPQSDDGLVLCVRNGPSLAAYQMDGEDAARQS